MIDSLLKSPKIFFGLLLLSLLTACQSEKSPAETTRAFWSAIADNNIELAKKYCNAQTQPLLSTSLLHELQNASFGYGKKIIDGNQATIETKINHSGNQKAFTTFLVREDNRWKVDCQRSIENLSGDVFKGLLKNLNTLGKSLNQQLEQQLPLFEKKIESLADKLKQQMNNFGDKLKKSFPKKQQNPYQDTI